MASNPWNPLNCVEIQCLEACIEIPRSQGLKVVFLKFLRALELQSHDVASEQVTLERESYDTVGQVLAKRKGWNASFVEKMNSMVDLSLENGQTSYLV